MKIIAAILAAISAALSLQAAEPIHTFKLKNCAQFEVVSPLGWISVYPLSEGMQKVARAGSRNTIIAADYSVGVLLKTANPSSALQAVVRQIHEQTGRPLSKFSNSTIEQMAPSTMLMAADAESVWCLVLTPKADQPDTYLLSCGFVIDRKNDASDGVTPVAAASK